MIEPAVNEHDRRLAFLSVIPKLQFQSVRIKEM